MATKRTPTPQQSEILAGHILGPQVMVIIAGAGSGKSTTLRMLAEENPGQTFLYIVYNRAAKDDASKSFPKNVTVKTAHGLAYGPTVTPAIKRRLNGPRVPAWKAAGILGVRRGIQLGDHGLDNVQVVRLALETVARFCKSDRPTIESWMVPAQPGMEDHRDELRSAILPLAIRVWEDVTSANGQLKFEHDHYLKLYQLSKPELNYDVIMLDEAQDANPLMADIVTRQRGRTFTRGGVEHQVMLRIVGDPNQAINGWNGAVDAITDFAELPGTMVKYLTKSFRFGAAVAAEGNKYLGLVGTDMRIEGFELINSSVGPIEHPDAILCRTNGGVLSNALRFLGQGRKVAIVGGGTQIKMLAQAAVSLRAGKGSAGVAELAAFRTWQEVEQYAQEDASGADLRVFVKMVSAYGAEEILAAMERLVSETQAEIVVSTAHKSKGREWDRVQIGDDFAPPKNNEDGSKGTPSRETMMLLYVAVTRAKLELDAQSLAWIEEYI
jgi:hypothetical protein